MKVRLKIWIRSLCDKVLYWVRPDQDEIISSLVLYTASLELNRSQYLQLAPIKGCTGPFKLMGNSLPVFVYRVFDKKMMEFINVTVEIAKPNTIRFSSKIDFPQDSLLHMKEVETKERYKAPFNHLVMHLIRYFPFAMPEMNKSRIEVKSVETH